GIRFGRLGAGVEVRVIGRVRFVRIAQIPASGEGCLGPSGVARGIRLPEGSRIRGGTVGPGQGNHQTSRSSASFFEGWCSTLSTLLFVRSSSSEMARVTSSSPASPSFLIRSRTSLAWRRMLRMETFPSSALLLTILTYSLRRSSVSSGRTTRMTLPSLALVVLGHEDRPGLGRLERRELLERGRCTVVVDLDVGEQCGVGAAGADRREVVLCELDGLVHLLSGLGQCLFNHGSLFPSL